MGPLVARTLSGRLPRDARLVVRAGDMMSLIEDWADVDVVICVDAAARRGAPGRVHRIDLAKEALPPELSFTSSHAFGLAEAIELARVLELAPKQIVVYAIEGACFDTGAPFTPEVLSAASEVADCIAGEVCHISQRDECMNASMSIENSDQQSLRVRITGMFSVRRLLSRLGKSKCRGLRLWGP